MVVIGGAICAAGVFTMLPPAWFAPAVNSPFGQWLGHGYPGLEGSINPYYVMTALYLTVFRRRSLLLAASLRIRTPSRRPARKAPTAHWLIPFSSASFSSARPVDPCGFLSRGRAAPTRHDVACLCARRFGCAHWAAAFQPLHPCPGSRPIGSRLSIRHGLYAVAGE